MNERPTPLDTPLWQFALAVYSRDGVSAECIELQDRLGLDVNLLLFAAYAGAVERAVVSGEAVKVASESVASWHDNVVVPLRQARRALKPWAAKQETEALRTTVKAAELEGERIELALLWSWLRSQDLPRAPMEEAAIENLRQVLVRYESKDANPNVIAPRLCAAALAQARQ